MTYNSLVSERFATYQINIALLDNGTNISFNTREIKHHLSTSKQLHKNWRYELLSTNSCLDDYLRSKRFIIRRFVLVKDTNLYFLTMWVVHKGLHINNQKQNNQKWNIPCLKYGLVTTNPSKSLPQTLHSILDSLCCPLSLCGMSWLPLAKERNIIIGWNYEWTHKLTYHTHEIFLGILKQWSYADELISPWGQGKWEIKQIIKSIIRINCKFMFHWLLILFNLK